MCNLWKRARWDGESKRHSLRPEVPPSEIEEHAGAENPPAQSKRTSTSGRARYTLEDDAKIRQLKEQGLSWLAIAKHFPARTAGAIEVRYYTRLKTSDASQSESRQLYSQSRAPSPVIDDADKEEEWEVEICGHRKLSDGSVELLVR